MTMLPITEAELVPISTADFLALRQRLFTPPIARDLAEREAAADHAAAVAKAKAESAAFDALFADEVAQREWIAAAKAKFDANAVQSGTPAAVAEIMRSVAASYGIAIAAMIGRGRFLSLIRPRQEAMYRIAVECPKLSLSTIGRHFGGRDHSTVLYGIQQHCKLNGIAYPKRAIGPKEIGATKPAAAPKPKVTPRERRVARMKSVHRMIEWSRR